MGNLNWQVETLGEEMCQEHLFIDLNNVHCTSFYLQVILKLSFFYGPVYLYLSTSDLKAFFFLWSRLPVSMLMVTGNCNFLLHNESLL